MRDDLREYLTEHLGDAENGVLLVDQTGFPRRGNTSCGVASRYCGTPGSRTNCQVGVFLGDASRHRIAFLDRALYLPRVWTDGTARRAAAGVPKGVRFATKPTLAKHLLARAFAANVRAHWVVADSLSGRAHHSRRWLEEEEQAHAVGVLPAHVMNYNGQRQ